MKLVDYILNTLKGNSVKYVFGVNGGAIAPLIDAITYENGIEFVPCLHECSAAYAAEGYARKTKSLGVVLVTSGPGGTNAITGLNCCWTDSIPVLFISGQVSSNHLIGTTNVRQRGVQETEILKIVKNITKYCNLQECRF